MSVFVPCFAYLLCWLTLCLKTIKAKRSERDDVAVCCWRASWAATFLPMPMPKTVCRTSVYNKMSTAGGLYIFFGQGYGYEYHSITIIIIMVIIIIMLVINVYMYR